MINKARKICEQLLPDQKDVVIAGGYAALSYSSKDLDLWALNTDPEEVEPLYTRISSITSCFKSPQTADYNFGIFPIATTYFKAFHIPVHILSFSGSVHDLLSMFDISTHVIAFDPYTEEVFKEDYTTGTNEPPQVIWGSVRAPDSTLERYVRICRRYFFLPEISTMTKLHDMWREI